MPPSSIYIALGILANQALAGCIQSTLRPCPSPPDPWLGSCPKGIPKKWACLDAKLPFITVDCIVADIKACGTLDNNQALLYSFGVKTVEAREKVRDKLKPRPVMFNDVLPKSWVDAVAVRHSLVQGKIADPGAQARADEYVVRLSAALTKSAKGEVIIVTATRNSPFGGSGAYSLPDPKHSKPNVWRVYEFPTAQRNPAVTKVVSIALDDPKLDKDPRSAMVVDWDPKAKIGAQLPAPRFIDPPLPPKNAQGPSTPAPAPGPSNPNRPSTPPAGPSNPKRPTTPPAGPSNPKRPTTPPAGPSNPKRPTTPPPAPASPKRPSTPPSPPKKPVKPKNGRKSRAIRRQQYAKASI